MALKPYNTIRQKSEIEITINKSRFIGRAYPVKSEEEALSILAEIRKRHYDATHNCYAYSVRENQIARFSDDGEPSGTAGMPMMEVLKAKQLTDTLVIVTRYFGGILLGAGGLVRAYSRSTADALDEAKPITFSSGTKIMIKLDYSRFNSVEDFIRQNADIKKIEYFADITLEVIIKTEEADKFCLQLTEKTDGRAVYELIGEDYMESDI